ncbi:AMP-binding enzyme [Nocardioides piscis]|uniref:Long-chain fatty acid--CoA ligase n=1 Tax=Nocardioides piscis TaxID=2714938 RepID=A0A6G7YHS4_9ACTN|nr:AMP-binding protein [Nocardioides piscis]QIK76188.1 long-chain fatty acid--CoA ligase [Nocardioides piscis]
MDVLGAEDPLVAFTDAHREHRLLALRTSGTAGSPRTVVRTTESWMESFPHVSALLGIDSSSRVWVPGPITATMNLFAAAHADWAGAALATGPHDATHAHLTPWALRRELATRPGDLAGLHVLTAGDRLERTTYDAARSVGAEVSHYYGAAELSFVAWGDHADALRPFPGVEVASRDGALWVRSPYTCQGYREDEHLLQRDAEGWVGVGDRGEVVDGFVRVHGRDGGITTGGATVLVADIERPLREQTTGDLAVVGLPHADLGEVVVAVVSRHDDVARLASHARRVLDPAQRPRRWLHLDPLPRNPTGKIDRVALAAEVAAMAARGGDE